MASELYEKGLAKRKSVLGDEYVDRALDAGPFASDFQAYLTEYCWGAVWTDDTLSDKQRSMLNVAMLATLNRMHEWELHFRGALTNGVTEAWPCTHPEVCPKDHCYTALEKLNQADDEAPIVEQA